MSADPRGKCVIINNTLFTNMSDRGGSTFDAVNLSELFRKLHFDIDIWTDKTAKVCSYFCCLVTTEILKYIYTEQKRCRFQIGSWDV